MNQPLSAAAIREYAPELELPLQVFDIIDSTNNFAKQNIPEGAADGTLIVANQQTAGRGRAGHSFYSPAGTGLYLSLIRSLNSLPPDCLLLLTPAAAVASAEAIQEVTGISTGIKWVNDLYVGTHKVSGILCEAVAAQPGQAPDHVVLGIGINCSTESFPSDIRNTAGSLGTAVDRNALTAALWKRLLYWTEHAKDSALIDQYRARSILTGKTIRFAQNGSEQTATVTGISDEAHLLVRLPDGADAELSSGEIQILHWD